MIIHALEKPKTSKINRFLSSYINMVPQGKENDEALKLDIPINFKIDHDSNALLFGLAASKNMAKATVMIDKNGISTAKVEFYNSKFTLDKSKNTGEIALCNGDNKLKLEVKTIQSKSSSALEPSKSGISLKTFMMLFDINKLSRCGFVLGKNTMGVRYELTTKGENFKTFDIELYYDYIMNVFGGFKSRIVYKGFEFTIEYDRDRPNLLTIKITINGFDITFDINFHELRISMKKIEARISTKKILEGIRTESITRSPTKELTMQGGI